MSPLFKKGIKADEFFEKIKNKPNDEHKVTLLGMVLSKCKGKYKDIGFKVVDEVLSISKNPVADLNSLIIDVRDNDLGAYIVDKIASYGMEKKEVHEKMWSIGSATSMDNRGARKRAREHYDRYYDQVTGGNPLKKPDLLIPDW